MDFKTSFSPPVLQAQLQHRHKVLLLGSCFTEHMSKRMANAKMQVIQNPSGILFNPISVAKCLHDIISHKQYGPSEMFEINEAYHNWYIHSKLGNPNINEALSNINNPLSEAHLHIQTADWVIITLGSAFAYWHNNEQLFVSNNHRASMNLFTKILLTQQQITDALQQQIDALKILNPDIQILFTISPVRHLRDGLIDNNRSKARLIEATHSLIAANVNVQYFAAYEIVIDELRDYRFYDIDFAHPNFMATEYVWQQFMATAIAPADHALFDAMADINIATQHKSSNVNSKVHQAFLASYAAKCQTMLSKYPYLNLSKELRYFNAV
jgi:GSCFA family